MHDEQQHEKPRLHVESDWKSQVEAERAGAEAPKIHVDSDWKAQAQAEKERLEAESEKKQKDRPAGGRRELPEASFSTLVSVLASQAIMGLGTMTDPQSGGVIVDLEGAKFSIDLLEVLEEKTKGNLTDEERTELVQIAAELRNRFVQIADLVARQAAGGGGAPTPGGPGGPGGIMPPGSPGT